MLGMMAGCAASKSASEAASAASSAAAVSASEPAASASASTGSSFIDVDSKEEYSNPDAPTYKIGFSYYSFTDKLGAQFKKVLEYTAKQFGCEMIFQEWPTVDTEGIVEANENLIEAGCDGIVTGFVTPATIDACEKANIPYVQACGVITDAQLLETAMKTKTYVGSISEDDYQAGYDLVQGLYDSGVRKMAYVAATPGTSSAHDNRVRGIEQFLKDHTDMQLVTNYRSSNMSEMADGVRQIWTAYPEIEGIASTGVGEPVISAIYADGLQSKIKFACVDILEDTDVYLNDGTMVWTAGGQYPTMQIAFTLLYNFLSGHDMITDKSEFLYRNFMYIRTPEDYENYGKYMEGEIPAYSGNELKKLCVVYNPDATLDMVKEYDKAYSIQDVVERHKDLY
jgi:simple sugar transport system substrate-binding protein